MFTCFMKLILTTLTAFLLALTGYAQSSKKIYNDIFIQKLTDKAYMHISVAPIEGFGNVASNGVILVDNGEAFLFDTPVSNEQTERLVKYITDSLKAKIVAFVPNHWHLDCMGGLEYLHKNNVKSFANQMTIDIAKKEGKPLPQHGFTDSLTLKLNNIQVVCYYFGGGHSTDNIVVWLPTEKVLFPGCMVKDLKAKGLGNLSDAAVDEWLPTIEKIISKFPDAEIVVPGHGYAGTMDILHHTKQLLQK